MKMLSKPNSFYSFVLVVSLLFTATIIGCTEDPVQPDPVTPNRDSLKTVVTSNITTNIILPTYAELRDKTAALRDAAAVYSASQTETNWLAARAAWYAARDPWEACEAFIFGPADFKALDPALDLWPLNRTDLDSILNSTISLTPEAVANFNENVKGSHTAEYLLFGDTNQKVFSQMTSREIEYLVAVTVDIAKNTEILYNEWSPADKNYADHFLVYPNTRYATANDGLSEMITGMIDLSVELYETKMEVPLASKELKYDESAFSDNSIKDFQHNLLCIKRMYTGENGSHVGKGISAVVLLTDTLLDNSVRQKIAASEAAVAAITPTFGKAILNNSQTVRDAITAVEKLYRVLEDSVRVVILR
ncbi:MAG TPA: imelysin family protein [Candidatus Kapabacteria bacterium]